MSLPPGMWDAGLENTWTWGQSGLRDDEDLGTLRTQGCVDSRACGLGGEWTQGSVNSGTCGLGDDVNFGMCQPGNVWTQDMWD